MFSVTTWGAWVGLNGRTLDRQYVDLEQSGELGLQGFLQLREVLGLSRIEEDFTVCGRLALIGKFKITNRSAFLSQYIVDETRLSLTLRAFKRTLSEVVEEMAARLNSTGMLASNFFLCSIFYYRKSCLAF